MTTFHKYWTPGEGGVALTSEGVLTLDGAGAVTGTTIGGVDSATGTRGGHTAQSLPHSTEWERHIRVNSAEAATGWLIAQASGVQVAISDSRFGLARWRGISHAAAAHTVTLYADGVAVGTETDGTAAGTDYSFGGIDAHVTHAGVEFGQVLDAPDRAAWAAGNWNALNITKLYSPNAIDISGAEATWLTVLGVGDYQHTDPNSRTATALVPRLHGGQVAEVDGRITAATGLVRTTAQTLTVAEAAQARGNLQIGNPGGVAISAAGYFTGSCGTAADYSVSYYVSGMAALGPLLLSATGGGASVTLYAAYDSVYLDCAGGGGLGTGTGALPVLSAFWLTVERTGLRTFKVYRNGVEVLSYTATADTSTAYPLPVALAAYAYQPKFLRNFNRALTTDERAAVMRGETPVILADRAASYPAASVAVDYNWVSSGGTIATNTGGVLSASRADASPFYSIEISEVGGPNPALQGTKVRVYYTLSVASGVAPRALVSSGNIDTTRYSLTAGSNYFDAVFNAATSSGGLRLLIESVGATDFTLSAIAFVRIGTVADYRPENVTSLGRWINASANAYDLIPGAGVTALNPQPVQVREAWIKYDIGGSAPTVLTNSSCIFSAVKSATGAFTIQVKDFIPSANRISATCSPFEADPAYVQARGQGILAAVARQYVLLTKAYTADTLVDVSYTAAVRWTE